MQHHSTFRKECSWNGKFRAHAPDSDARCAYSRVYLSSSREPWISEGSDLAALQGTCPTSYTANLWCFSKIRWLTIAWPLCPLYPRGCDRHIYTRSRAEMCEKFSASLASKWDRFFVGRGKWRDSDRLLVKMLRAIFIWRRCEKQNAKTHFCTLLTLLIYTRVYIYAEIKV